MDSNKLKFTLMRNTWLFIFPKLFAFMVFHQALSITAEAQQPKTEEKTYNESNIDYHEVKLTYPDGTIYITTYEVRYVDGKKVEIKLRTHKEVVDKEHQQKTLFDTIYHSNSQIAASTDERRYSGEQIIFHEFIQYDKFNNLTFASKSEVGYDNKIRTWEKDSKSKEYRFVGEKPFHPTNPNPSNTTTSCTKPSSVVFGGYARLTVKSGDEKIHYNGGEINYTWYFPTNEADVDLSDSMASMHYRPKTAHQFGATGGMVYVTQSQDDARSNLIIITVGPEFRLTGDQFGGTIFVQGGMAEETFKFGDFKDKDNAFVARAGLSFDWYFNHRKNFGVSARPQVLMTKFDETEFNFLGSAGIIIKMGCGNK